MKPYNGWFVPKFWFSTLISGSFFMAIYASWRGTAPYIEWGAIIPFFLLFLYISFKISWPVWCVFIILFLVLRKKSINRVCAKAIFALLICAGILIHQAYLWQGNTNVLSFVTWPYILSTLISVIIYKL